MSDSVSDNRILPSAFTQWRSTVRIRSINTSSFRQPDARLGYTRYEVIITEISIKAGSLAVFRTVSSNSVALFPLQLNSISIRLPETLDQDPAHDEGALPNQAVRTQRPRDSLKIHKADVWLRPILCKRNCVSQGKVLNKDHSLSHHETHDIKLSKRLIFQIKYSALNFSVPTSSSPTLTHHLPMCFYAKQ